MAPQVKLRLPYGLKADIWSLGVIFFRMIFGKCPFQSNFSEGQMTETISKCLDKNCFYQGVEISSKVKKFLKQVLVTDINKRIGWKQLVDHQIFKQDEQNLNDTFNRRFSIVGIEKQIQDIQRDLIITDKDPEPSQLEYNIKEKDKRQLSDIQKSNQKLINEKSSQVNNQDNGLTEISEEQIRVANDQLRQLYEWARRIHIQCLKTQLIYKQIIQVIEKNNVFQMKNRKEIEFLYLLCTRCFNNISPINYLYQKTITQRSIEIIFQSWIKVEKYSSLLTKKQDQNLQMALDRTKKLIFSPQKYEQNLKNLTGVQSMSKFKTGKQPQYQDQQMKRMKTKSQSGDQGLKDYTKEQQIKYVICRFDKISQRVFQRNKSYRQILKYLCSFKKICQITIQDLRAFTFREYVKTIVN